MMKMIIYMTMNKEFKTEMKIMFVVVMRHIIGSCLRAETYIYPLLSIGLFNYNKTLKRN
jgi:hypothetical protein